MKIFITANFQRERNKEEIEYLCQLVKSAGLEDFCFIRDIENYKKTFNNPQDLMQKAKEEISNSDALLIDVTNKPTGRAIEAGIAFSLNKKIIVIAKKGTKIKETTLGIAALVIKYDDIKEIVVPLRKWAKSNK